jgi:methyl-accepting chemotaxis protein
VFFISPEGDVLYTVAKEDDYGTNLLDGPYADTGLGRLFQYLHASPGGDRVEFEDFSRYPPSNNQPAAFLGARVYADDEYVGVWAVQIPDAPVNEIMQFSAGMGETGETYLVGEDGLMRSDSRFFDTSSVLDTKVTGATVAKAFSGEIGLEIVDDYRGIPVYSAYRLFEFEGIRWAVLAEQDVAEVTRSVKSVRLWIGGGFVALCLVALLLRFMLLRVVLPTSIAAFLGVALIPTDED